MENLNPEDVCQFLRKNNIPDEVVSVFEGMIFIISALFFNLFLLLFCKVNEIDGASLLLLPEDFQEFQLLVPKGGIRMKIKSLVQNYSTGVCSTNVEVRSCMYLFIFLLRLGKTVL